MDTNQGNIVPIVTDRIGMSYLSELEKLVKVNKLPYTWVNARMQEIAQENQYYSCTLQVLDNMMHQPPFLDHPQIYDGESLLIGGIVGYNLFKREAALSMQQLPLIKEKSAHDAYTYLYDEKLLEGDKQAIESSFTAIENRNKQYTQTVSAPLLRRASPSTQSLKLGGILGYTLIFMELTSEK